MKKGILLILLIIYITGCEEVYNPAIDIPEEVLVVDARIIDWEEENYIRLNLSKGINETEKGYSNAKGADVQLIDDRNEIYNLSEVSDGTFKMNFPLDSMRSYQLKISYAGEIYESGFESVPSLPKIDSIYGLLETNIVAAGGENDVNDFIKNEGFMLYADILNDDKLRYYRFSARKTYQYTYNVLDPNPMVGGLTIFAWESFFPFQNSYNIAAPPEYSQSIDIKKHSLYFMERSVESKRTLKYRNLDGFNYSFMGWILFLYQYSISESAYNFYKDANSVLEANGRLFDPLYVQARNNMKCTSNPSKLVLGNFEINSRKEYRYFVRFISDEEGYLLKPIPHYYNIPFSGEVSERGPEFWETPWRTDYP